MSESQPFVMFIEDGFDNEGKIAIFGQPESGETRVGDTVVYLRIDGQDAYLSNHKIEEINVFLEDMEYLDANLKGMLIMDQSFPLEDFQKSNQKRIDLMNQDQQYRMENWLLVSEAVDAFLQRYAETLNYDQMNVHDNR